MTIKKIRPRKINNIIHRDLGYLLAGTAILYAISGLALNHLDHWNPNFMVHRENVQMQLPQKVDQITRAIVIEALEPLGEQENYRSHDSPTSKKLKIYLDDGSVMVSLKDGQAVYESVRRRPFFFEINCLHLNPKAWWLVFSDLFAVALILVTVTGLFVLKGRKGITGRGAILIVVGLIIPLLFLLGVA